VGRQARGDALDAEGDLAVLGGTVKAKALVWVWPLRVTRALVGVPRFNVAPTQDLPVIIDTADGLTLRLMGWGFEPWWMRNKVKRRPQINARAETLLESPLFRDAAISQPCLIPADGFYEWTGAPGTRTSQPVHVRLKGGELLAFAGI